MDLSLLESGLRWRGREGRGGTPKTKEVVESVLGRCVAGCPKIEVRIFLGWGVRRFLTD
jgi:hypothetical protein